MTASVLSPGSECPKSASPSGLTSVPYLFTVRNEPAPIPAALADRRKPQSPMSFMDARGQRLAHVYFEDEPQRQMSMQRIGRGEAWQLARAITRIPALLNRD